MKIYSPDDESLIEYYSEKESDFDDLYMHSEKVKEFAKFYNTNYHIVTSLEEKITKHGHLNVNVDGSDNAIGKVIETELIGYNMMSLFSLAKIKQVKNEYVDKESIDRKRMTAEDFAEAKSKAST